MISPNGNRIAYAGGAIAGVVAAVPKNIVTNEGWPDAIAAAKMTGVLQRRRATTQTTEDLCTAAAEQLLADLGWPASTIGALVYVTQTPGMAVPASAYSIHARLGLPTHCPAVEVNWSCAGYVYGLWLAMRLADPSGFAEEPGGRVLLLVGDTSSTITDPHDSATAPVFGDAGSATAIIGGFDAGEVRFVLGTDGKDNGRLSQKPGAHLTMDGPSVFSFTLRTVPGLVEDTLPPEMPKPDLLLFHQANRYMLRHLAAKCGLLERFDRMSIPSNIEEYGNCACASIPLLIATDVGVEPHNWTRRVAMFGYGAGWAWAGATLDTAQMRVSKLIEI